MAGKKVACVGDEAVKKSTGKSWDEWFRILDRAGAKKMTHKEIAAYLAEHHIDSGWWSQTVTVGYEQASGLRDKHEMPTGYAISRSRTLPVSVDTLYSSWKDKRRRKRWLDDAEFEVRKSTPGKSMRITWVDGRTHLNVHFHARGESKSQVTVQHGKLKTRAEAERKKAYWGKALDRLKTALT
jgi:hypothetical protein